MTTATTNKRIVLLNASALKEFSCQLKFYRTVFEGYASNISSIDMEYGSAFHLFVAEMNKSGGAYAPSMKAALDYFRDSKYGYKKSKEWMTAQHLTQTCMSYWEHYNGDNKKDEWQTINGNTWADCQSCVGVGNAENPPDSVCNKCKGKGKLSEALVEMKFAIPYYVDDYCEILLAGTMDDVCKRHNGCYAIRDYKTTSVWDTKGYLASYALNPQLMFYVFVLYEYARQFPDSIFQTICSKGRVGAFIDGVFLKSKEVNFERSEVFFFNDRQLNEFKKMIDTLVVPAIVRMVREGQPMKEGILNGTCHNVYGACKYAHACEAPDDIAAGHILRNEFTVKPYNPLDYHA